MNVSWLHDDPGYVGGAELTMREFAAAAPENVTIDYVAGNDPIDGDVVVIGNCVQYDAAIVDSLMGKVVWRYHHDLAFHEPVELRAHLDHYADHIFTSPIHAERYDWAGGSDYHIVPPAMNLARFKPNCETRRQVKRKGAVSVGAWQNPGKGAELLDAWARSNGGIDIYGFGPYAPLISEHVNHMGAVDQADLPAVLHQYETFVFLPRAVEPFGRCVVEAWAAGCHVVTNKLVGSRYWIEREPDKLETAAQDFWAVVLCE